MYQGRSSCVADNDRMLPGDLQPARQRDQIRPAGRKRPRLRDVPRQGFRRRLRSLTTVREFRRNPRNGYSSGFIGSTRRVPASKEAPGSASRSSSTSSRPTEARFALRAHGVRGRGSSSPSRPRLRSFKSPIQTRPRRHRAVVRRTPLLACYRFLARLEAMKAAIVAQRGQSPIYGEFRTPEPSPGKRLVRVRASSISHLTRGRASGAHYSSDGTPPFVPGVDGAGIREDGRRGYFLMPESPFGAMAEMTLVDDRHWIDLPDTVTEEQAAAMAIPGMSSWGRFARAGGAPCRRNGSGQRGNRFFGPSGHPDLKTPGRKARCCHGPKSPGF